jgi:hypothetical protein
VFIRIALIVALSVSLAACAQSPMIGASYLGVGGLQEAPSAPSTGSRAVEVDHLDRPTLAGKVLTAIALERITGLKPDPARFSEIE